MRRLAEIERVLQLNDGWSLISVGFTEQLVVSATVKVNRTITTFYTGMHTSALAGGSQNFSRFSSSIPCSLADLQYPGYALIPLI
jgi:hypothetical protein